jgi:hypothetical protein
MAATRLRNTGLLPTRSLGRTGSGRAETNAVLSSYALQYTRRRWIQRSLAILSAFLLLYMTVWNLLMGDQSSKAGPGTLGGPGRVASYDGHVVLAVATNTTAESLSIFINSWKAYAPGHRIVVFAESDVLDAPGVGQYLRELHVDAVQVHRPPLLDDIFDEEEPQKPGRLVLASLRQVAKFVGANGVIDWGTVKGVALVTTAGDVVLQGDPFEDNSVKQYIPKQGIVLALNGGPELGAVRVAADTEMVSSLRDCFGMNMAEKMSKLSLINGHVVLGAHRGMSEFLDLVVDVLGTRTRERCLSHWRADLAAIQYSVGEFGRDPRNVDFPFSLRDHVTSTVYGVRYGLPCKIDSAGILRRRPPEGSARRGPTPTVISQYSSSSYLYDMYKGRYSHYARERLDFDDHPDQYSTPL